MQNTEDQEKYRKQLRGTMCDAQEARTDTKRCSAETG